jgi:hypothetical protein
MIKKIILLSILLGGCVSSTAPQPRSAAGISGTYMMFDGKPITVTLYTVGDSIKCDYSKSNNVSGADGLMWYDHHDTLAKVGISWFGSYPQGSGDWFYVIGKSFDTLRGGFNDWFVKVQ